MTQDYEPLSEAALAVIRLLENTKKELDYWRTRALAAERGKPAATPRHQWSEWDTEAECLHCMAIRTTTRPYKYKLPGGEWSSTRPECNK